jgi:uncharacterized protein
MPKTTRIGILSDTHGYLTPKVHQVFKGVDLIVHAGDIGDEFIIPELNSIAPVIAVCGNTDYGSLGKQFNEFETLTVGEFTLEITHIPWTFRQTNGRNIIQISGHTHKPRIDRENGVLVINPGSASKPRIVRQPSVALLSLTEGKRPEAEIIFFDK